MEDDFEGVAPELLALHKLITAQGEAIEDLRAAAANDMANMTVLNLVLSMVLAVSPDVRPKVEKAMKEFLTTTCDPRIADSLRAVCVQQLHMVI